MRLWEANSGTPKIIKPIDGLIRGITSDMNGNVFCVGRSIDCTPGWIIIKWEIASNSVIIRPLNIEGGSARSVFFANEKVMVGGDMPYWIIVNSTSLDVEKKVRIPGIYSGTQIDLTKVKGVDSDSLQLLGVNTI